MSKATQINLKCRTRVNGKPVVFYYKTVIEPVESGVHAGVDIFQIASDETLLVKKHFRVSIPRGENRKKALSWFSHMRNIDDMITRENGTLFIWDKLTNRFNAM